ncbi:MAG: hypothetical protein KKG13_00780 [Nanoarchaeota archaeon]|nr:hypothetical protein [Nanoarchaeota archaeon]
MRKAAFQMSLGMIVALVFAVILLTVSIAWINDVFDDITGVSKQVTDIAMQNLLDDMSSSGKKVGIAAPDLTTWKRGDTGSFAIGVRNDDPIQSKVYRMKIYWDYSTEDPSKIPSDLQIKEVERTLDYGGGTIFREAGGSNTDLVKVTIPTTAISGASYLFRVIVCKDIAQPCGKLTDPATVANVYGTDQFIIKVA